MSYNPADWYWVVGGSESQVWASARTAYVSMTDAAYLSWVAGGNAPTRIDSAASLGGVLNDQWVPLVLNAGIAVASTATPALNASYALDTASQNQISGISTGIAAGKGLPGGGTTFSWADVTGVPHDFTAADFLDFAAALSTYIYNFTQAIGLRLNGVPQALPTLPVAIP